MEIYNIIWFIGGLVTGITSFGGNMIAIPLMTLFFPPREAIIIGCVAGPAMSLTAAILYRKSILWKEIVPIALGGFVGVPLGILFLARAGSWLILYCASISLFLCLAWEMFVRHRIKPKTSGPLSAGLPGLFGGILMGATGMGGPPLAFYALQNRWDKTCTLGTLNMAIVIFMLIILPVQWFSGLLSFKLITTCLTGAAFSILGVLASIPLLKYINIRLFHGILLMMIALSAIVLLIRGYLDYH